MVRINSLPPATDAQANDSIALDTEAGTRKLTVSRLMQAVDLQANIPMVNVKAFGAFGDGLHDDTAAVQSAINAVGAYGTGGAIFFPASTPSNVYLVSTLHVGDRVWIVGEHREVTLRKLAGSAGPVVTQLDGNGGGANAAGFFNIQIDGNKANCPQSTDGIGQFPAGMRTGFRGDFSIFENVVVKNCKRHGINIGDASQGDSSPATYQVQMSNVWAHHCDGRGIVFDRVFDSYITNGWLNSNLLGGALFRRSATVKWTDGQIEGFGTASGADRPGVELGEHNSWISFIGCTFAASRHGIHVKGAAENIRINACSFSKNSDKASGRYDDVHVTPGAGQVVGLSILGCYFSADADDQGESGVGCHIRVDTPLPGGALISPVVSANTFMGSVGQVPLQGFISLPDAGVAGPVVDTNSPPEANGCSGLSSGVVQAAMPLGSYFREVSYQVPDATRHEVRWTHDVSDSQHIHDPLGGGTRFVIPTSGVYRVTASVDWATSSIGDRSIVVELTRADDPLGSVVAASRGGVDFFGRAGGTADTGGLWCYAGDSFKVIAYQSSGQTLWAELITVSVVAAI